MTRTTTQLAITIPEGAVPGSILSIPVKGRVENIKAKVPEGYGPGHTLVLTQLEGTDEWIEESVLRQAEQAAADARGPVGSDRTPTPPSDAVAPLGVDEASGDADSLVPDGPVAYTVRLDTTIGSIDIIVRPDWAPHGARRFLQLAQTGDLDGLAFYRSVKGCLAQFGLPAKRQWPPLPDDPPTGVPFLLGAVCFAAVGESSRKSTLFICVGDMSHCFGQSPWETPIGAVAEASLDVLDRIETCYGDIAECGGTGPDTGRIHAEGNNYLQANFPKLTYIKKATPLDWPPHGNGNTTEDANYGSTMPSNGTDDSAAQVVQAAQAMKAVFQGPETAGKVQKAGAAWQAKIIDVPVEVKTTSKAQPVRAKAFPMSTGGVDSSGNVRVIGSAAPLRFSAGSSYTDGSYVLPMGGVSSRSFEQQAHAQAQALLQAQRHAHPDQLAASTTSPSPAMCTNPSLHGAAPSPYVQPPFVQMHTGSYVPPPAQLGSFVPPPNRSFVPPLQSNGSFVPPVSPCMPLGSLQMPSLALGSPGSAASSCGGPFGNGCGGPCGHGCGPDGHACGMSGHGLCGVGNCGGVFGGGPCGMSVGGIPPGAPGPFGGGAPAIGGGSIQLPPGPLGSSAGPGGLGGCSLDPMWAGLPPLQMPQMTGMGLSPPTMPNGLSMGPPPSPGPGLGAPMGTGMGPSTGPGMGPLPGPGMPPSPGAGPGTGPGMGATSPGIGSLTMPVPTGGLDSGSGPGMGLLPWLGMGPMTSPEHGMGSAPGMGQLPGSCFGPPPGPGMGQYPGPCMGLPFGPGMGPPPGPGMGPPPGPGMGPQPGFGMGPPPGPGMGPPPGPGMGLPLGPGMGPQPGFGMGPMPNAGPALGPMLGPGLAGMGQLAGPGMGPPGPGGDPHQGITELREGWRVDEVRPCSL